MNDAKEILCNYQMDLYANVLNNFLEYSGKFGYAIARNYRNLAISSVDYLDTKTKLIQKYGHQDLDSNGDFIGTYTIDSTCEHYQEVSKELTDLGNIEHEVTIFKITYDDLPEDLSARDIISLEWMID